MLRWFRCRRLIEPPLQGITEPPDQRLKHYLAGFRYGSIFDKQPAEGINNLVEKVE